MDLSGAIVINKPEGKTSFDIVRAVKKKLGNVKVGHTGTLDPFATGVLPLCTGRATRLARFFTSGEKGYRGEIKLGASTDTYDRTGEVTARGAVPELSRDDIEKVFADFTGDVELITPMYSARKVGGERLYKLARKGVEVDRKPASTTINSIELENFDGKVIGFSMLCSSGTYVRSFAHEVGGRLGCCGYLLSLCRFRNGPFGIEDAVDFDSALSDPPDDYLISIDNLPLGFPRVVLNDREEQGVLRGTGFPAGGGMKELAGEEYVSLYSRKGKLLAVAVPEDRRGMIFIRPRVVIGGNRV